MKRDYLIDTNVLVHWVNGSRGSDRIEQRLFGTPREHLHTSLITVYEVARMVEKARVSSRATRALEQSLGMVNVVSLNEAMAALGGSLAGTLSNKGIAISVPDSLIAATAMHTGFVLVTDNVKDFQHVPGITLENWRSG